MQLRHLLDDYIAIALCDGSPKTIRLYRLTLKRFEEFIGEPAATEHLTDLWLGRFCRSRLDDGKAAHTVQGERSKLLALWNFAAKARVVEAWSQAPAFRVPQRTARAWTQEEFSRLWNACDFAGPVDDCPGHVWWRALLATLFDTSERISATLAIQWEWIDFESRTVHIPAEFRKGGRVDRAYEIGADTAERLQQIPRTKLGPFVTEICVETLRNRFNKLLVRAGLPTDSRSKFHRIRATTASQLEAVGASAQDQLGHSSRTVTKKYIDPRIVKPPAPCHLIPWRPGDRGNAQ